MTPGAAGPGRLLAWFTPAVPRARVAVLRAVIYVFVVCDMLFISNDVPAHGANSDLYAPLLLARLAHLPPVTTGGAWVLFAVTAEACAVAAAGALPRAAGGVAALGFLVWMLYSQGYGYVSHDHLALMVAVLVLPTAGRARFDDARTSEAAKWAVRAIQLAVVSTYFLSAVSKTVVSGSPATWANSAVFAWAFLRRGSVLVQWMLHLPWLFRPAQWCLLIIEVASPVVLFLRGRALYLAIGVFLCFHTATFVALGIHFLPTVVCWAAFVPLERLPRTWLDRRESRRVPAVAGDGNGDSRVTAPAGESS